MLAVLRICRGHCRDFVRAKGEIVLSWGVSFSGGERAHLKKRRENWLNEGGRHLHLGEGVTVFWCRKKGPPVTSRSHRPAGALKRVEWRGRVRWGSRGRLQGSAALDVGFGGSMLVQVRYIRALKEGGVIWLG